MNATTNPDASAPAKNRRTLVGRVVSDRMQKTVVVRVDRRVQHPVVGKTITRSKKYHAHLEGLEARVGDTVEIAECRPISKTKSWTVTRVIARARAL
ncbi:MAG: 30S ribosomal protein S17 [Burkholderiales bacterium]|nr:30S ribosomal protein S17 [Burkholderiales bacterium]